MTGSFLSTQNCSSRAHVSANSDFGPGGYIQYYIPDYDEVLKLIDAKRMNGVPLD